MSGTAPKIFEPDDPSLAHPLGNGVPYGPSRPDELGNRGYQDFTNQRYLEGYSRKILRDLTLLAKLYSGREVRIFALDRSKRCEVCTNIVTGEKLLSSCPSCHGTGYVDAWKLLGDFQAYVDFGPIFNVATPFGNTENPNGKKENIIVLGAPILNDQTLIIFKETREVYKIYDVLPQLIAMRGDVLAQIAQASRLSPGALEYKLIDW